MMENYNFLTHNNLSGRRVELWFHPDLIGNSISYWSGLPAAWLYLERIGDFTRPYSPKDLLDLYEPTVKELGVDFIFKNMNLSDQPIVFGHSRIIPPLVPPFVFQCLLTGGKTASITVLEDLCVDLSWLNRFGNLGWKGYQKHDRLDDCFEEALFQTPFHF